MALPLKSPDASGMITLSVAAKPVSTQASRTKKDIVTEAIRATIDNVEYFLSADVSIEIVWFINEEERYESDEGADVDNIIKPILDALSGPHGIVIDDCQVQFISCHWLSRGDELEHIEITMKYDPDAWFKKDNMRFVQLHKALCMPIPGNLSLNTLEIMLDSYEKQIRAREAVLANGGTYDMARSVMSIQRFFHKSRLQNFTVITLQDLRLEIGMWKLEKASPTR